MSTPIIPYATWDSGTNQNSIPANDNALRAEIFQRNVNNATTAQPVSPTDGASYIIQSTHTGTQWATFTPKDLAIYKGGTWYAFAPVEGNRVSVSGQVYIYSSGAWTAATGSAYDHLSPLTSAEISITGATTATLGRSHVCSGTTADYTVTLPAVSGNAGRSLTLRMAPGLTRWVTVDGNASELIDGALTRKMWANETCTLYCDGSAWTKISGKSIPIMANMWRNSAQSINGSTFTQIIMTAVIDDNTAGLAVPVSDLTNGRFLIPRAGYYYCSGYVQVTGMTSGDTVLGGVTKNSATPGDNPNAYANGTANAGGISGGNGAANFKCAAGDWVGTFTYQTNAAAKSTRAVASAYPTLSISEQPGW